LASRFGPLAAPNDPALPIDDHDPAGNREAGDEHPPAGKELRVGGVRHRRADRPEEAAVRRQAIDPAADLGHEEAAVREGRVAVRAVEAPRRVMDAAAAEDACDPAGVPQEDDPAVADVGSSGPRSPVACQTTRFAGETISTRLFSRSAMPT